MLDSRLRGWVLDSGPGLGIHSLGLRMYIYLSVSLLSCLMPGRQTDRQTGRQEDRQTFILKFIRTRMIIHNYACFSGVCVHAYIHTYIHTQRFIDIASLLGQSSRRKELKIEREGERARETERG